MRNQAQEKSDLQSHVDQIAETIRNGMTYEDAGIDHEDHGAEPGDTISGYEYLSDMLDIEYTINSNGDYLGARILVAFGGPNIWIDTRHCKVDGYWWGDEAKSTYIDEMDLHGTCQEFYETRG